jgi:hypothetical protein
LSFSVYSLRKESPVVHHRDDLYLVSRDFPMRRTMPAC